MKIRTFLISSAITYVGTILSIVLMMAYYGVALRGAGTESYGALQSIMSFTFLLHATRGCIGSYIVIHTGGDARRLSSIAGQAARLIACAAVGTACIFLAIAPFASAFLHLRDASPLLLIGLAALPGIAVGGVEGILNVQKKFVALSLSSIVGPACNLVGTYLLLRDGFQEIDAGWIILISNSVMLVHALLWMDRSFLAGRSARTANPKLLRDFTSILTSSILFGAVLRTDLFWAKHSLAATDASSYAIASSIGMILYLVSSGITRVASVSFRSEPAFKIVGVSYGIIVGVCLALGLGFAVAGSFALNILTGQAIPIDWGILLPLLLSFTFYSIITFDFTCLNVITKNVHVWLSVALASTQIIALALGGTSGRTIALVQCAVMFGYMLFFSGLLIGAVRKRTHAVPAYPAEHHLAPNA